MFRKKSLVAALILAMSAMSGCSNAPQKTVDDQVQERQAFTIHALKGKSVALDVAYFQKVKKEGTDELEVRPVEREKDNEMYKGVLLEDARLQLKTNEQLDFFQKYLERVVTTSGGQLAQEGSKADVKIQASLTYGPTPAPAYRSYNFGKSLGLGLLTLGLGPNSYDAVADYEIGLTLNDNNKTVEYKARVEQSSEHLKSSFNIGRWSEVQEAAMEAFRVTLEAQLKAFSAKVNQS